MSFLLVLHTFFLPFRDPFCRFLPFLDTFGCDKYNFQGIKTVTDSLPIRSGTKLLLTACQTAPNDLLDVWILRIGLLGEEGGALGIPSRRESDKPSFDGGDC